MDFSTLIGTLIGLFTLIAGGSAAGKVVTSDNKQVECYACTYYKGQMEINPQCKEVESSSMDVPTSSNCNYCKKQVLKYENETRILIKRQCARFCNHMKEIDLSFQDVTGVGMEYCCQEDLCNVGDNGVSNHLGVTRVLLLSALLSLLLTLL